MNRKWERPFNSFKLQQKQLKKIAVLNFQALLLRIKNYIIHKANKIDTIRKIL